MKNIKSILALSIMLSLTACGGGGSSSPEPSDPIPPTGGGNDGGDDGGNDDNGDGNGDTTAFTISGKVIDGYVSGATVFVDINGNGQLDDGEPNGESTDAGDYTLEISEANENVEECITFAPIVVDVPVGAIDEDLGEVEEAYTMTLPPINEDAFDSANITPLTSVLWETFQNDFALEDGNLDPVVACEQLLENHELISQFKDRLDFTIGKIVENYNISEDEIYSDFVASGNTASYDLAQQIVVGLKKSLAESNAIKEQSPNAVPLISYLKDSGEWVREEYIYTPASDVSSEGWSDNARVSAKTETVSSDFEQRFDTIYTYNRRSSFREMNGGEVEVAYFNETCNTADIFEYTEDPTNGQATKISVTNNDDSCIDYRYKSIEVAEYNNLDQQLGTIYRYSIAYSDAAGGYTMFDYMEDFHGSKESLNVDSILNDATSYEFSMSEDYDVEQLMENFTIVETRVREMDGENLVDTSRVINSGGASWKRKTTFPDGTSETQCKDSRDAAWGACE
tara:strand:- start:51924 stop:53456 length:1533 start_codon:yes stop_codon:yes gene_type:complete